MPLLPQLFYGPIDEQRRRDFEHLRDGENDREGRLALSALEQRRVRSVETRAQRERLLRKLLAQPQFAQHSAEGHRD
jgi:hypothetical protein